MKKFKIYLSILLGSIVMFSCELFSTEGNGKVVEETRNLGDFDKLEVTRGMNVFITQGNSVKVVVKADANLMKIIETKVDDGTLKVTCNRGIRNATSNKFLITVPDINQIKTTAGSNVFADDTLKLKSIEIKSTAGSNVHLKVIAENLKLKATSGANVFMSGIGKSANIVASSGANIKASGLKTENCIAALSSGANVWLEVQKSLTVSSSTGGNFYYTGDPEPAAITKNAGGNVIKE